MVELRACFRARALAFRLRHRGRGRKRPHRCPSRRKAAPSTAELSPAAQREHQRILAAYNGVYEDPGLEALVNQTVEKLVAASGRPEQHYRVTILNSPAINAFALPSGQLYVTRGLIALADNSSELASVLSHEMAHVIASHAAIREDKARQVAPFAAGRLGGLGEGEPDPRQKLHRRGGGVLPVAREAGKLRHRRSEVRQLAGVTSPEAITV